MFFVMNGECDKSMDQTMNWGLDVTFRRHTRVDDSRSNMAQNSCPDIPQECVTATSRKNAENTGVVTSWASYKPIVQENSTKLHSLYSLHNRKTKAYGKFRSSTFSWKTTVGKNSTQSSLYTFSCISNKLLHPLHVNVIPFSVKVLVRNGFKRSRTPTSLSLFQLTVSATVNSRL